MTNSIQLVSLLLAAICSAAPKGCVINFNSDTTGNKSTPFTSVDCASVSFHGDASQGGVGQLYLADPGIQGVSGNALAVRYDDASALKITFTQPATFLEVWFGNDDSWRSAVGDVATLRVYSRGVQVAKTTVLNRDDLANQKIAVSTLKDARSFDTARFQYTKPSGTPLKLIELIDDVTVTFDRFLKSCPCRRNWRNHAQYQSCIDKEARDLVTKGLLTAKQRNYLVKNSDKSTCGRKQA